jgi:hypothetical protein
VALEICLPVIKEKVRAEVYMGSTLISKTPYVKSFNVHKARGQASNTFTVTLEILGNASFPIGGMLTIKAGLKGELKEILTGTVESTQVHPVLGKPAYYSLTLSGKGVLSKLENKTFSRRLKSDGQGMFCMITGGPSNRTDKFKTLDKIIKVGNQESIVGSPSPAKGAGEQSALIVSNTNSAGASTGGALEDIASPMTNGTANSGGEGFRTHTHENMDEGGPAFAVYSSD